MTENIAARARARGVRILAVGACILGTSAFIAACAPDDVTPSPPAADSPKAAEAPSSSPGPNGSTATAVATEDLIAEGGGLPSEDSDAGADDDAGIDAGPACGSVATGAYATTTCSNRLVSLAGGALTTTTYELSTVTVLGSATFCANTFTAYEHRGGLKVTASSPTEAKLEVSDLYRKSGSFARPTMYRYDAQVVASETNLTFTPAACSVKPAPAKASYAVGTANGKKTLVLRLPYGITGSALYRFIEP